MNDSGESLISNWNPTMIAQRNPVVKLDSLIVFDFLCLNSVDAMYATAGMMAYSSVVGKVGDCVDAIV